MTNMVNMLNIIRTTRFCWIFNMFNVMGNDIFLSWIRITSIFVWSVFWALYVLLVFLAFPFSPT